VDPALARQVADQLMAKDALAAHAREELGITDLQRARPVQAAFASATTFAVGAALPLAVGLLAPIAVLTVSVGAASLVSLASLGALAARAGGASPWVGAWRDPLECVAMAPTYAVGVLFGTTTRRLSSA
jgi:VIT1/CCC1 family predicted Fe2+/Mn2+ transporter